VNQYELTIAALLGLQIITLIVLWHCHVEREWFRKAWLRESTELLNIKKGQINA
jgi:hypothetical protein